MVVIGIRLICDQYLTTDSIWSGGGSNVGPISDQNLIWSGVGGNKISQELVTVMSRPYYSVTKMQQIGHNIKDLGVRFTRLPCTQVLPTPTPHIK